MPVQIKGFIENSLIEWEGMICSIIFLSGCNFRCSYCHSPHLVDPPEDMETIPLEVVTDYLTKNRAWLDGVVISGGEPTLHNGLKELLKRLKALGLKVKLDTNGTNPTRLKELIEERLVDCIAMDVKAPLDDRSYSAASGSSCNVQDLRRSVRVIIESGLEHEFRTTVCPTFLGEKEIEDIARSLQGARRYVLQPFRPNNCLDRSMLIVTPYPLDKLRHFKEIAGSHVGCCYIRGEAAPVVSQR